MFRKRQLYISGLFFFYKKNLVEDTFVVENSYTGTFCIHMAIILD